MKQFVAVAYPLSDNLPSAYDNRALAKSAKSRKIPTMNVKVAALSGLASLVALNAPAQTEKAVVGHYAALVEATYADALNKATTMEKAIEDFLAEPSSSALDTARAAWTAAPRAPCCTTRRRRASSSAPPNLPVTKVRLSVRWS